MVEEPPLRDLRLGPLSANDSAGWAKFFHSDRTREELCRRQHSGFGHGYIARAAVIRFFCGKVLMGKNATGFTPGHAVSAARLISCIWAILLAAPCAPAQRLVFAHYMLANQDY